MHFIIPGNHCFVSVPDWMSMQCYLSTSASPANPHFAFREKCWCWRDCCIMKNIRPKDWVLKIIWHLN